MDKGVNYANYDTYNDNGKLDASLATENNVTINEQLKFHQSVFEEFNSADTATVWIVPKVIEFDNSNSIYGVASYAGSKSLFLSKNIDERTFAHEVVHALFSLRHPDSIDYIKDGLKDPVLNDEYNLMNSGTLDSSFSNDLTDYKIRKYQWFKIHKNL